LESIKNDAASQDFISKLRKFAKDFAFDVEGRPDIYQMQHSLSEIRRLLIPLLGQELEMMKIGKFEISDESWDFVVDELTLSVKDVLPHFFELKSKNLIVMDVKKLEPEKFKTKITMEVKQLRPLFKDMKFFYRRKSFPKISDYGTADVDLTGGEGTKIKVVWLLKGKSNQPFLISLAKVKCVIDKLDITIKEAKHEILDRLAVTFFAGQIKKSIAQAIVHNIVQLTEPFNAKLNEFFQSKPLDRLGDATNVGLQQAYESTAHYFQPVVETTKKVLETAKEQAKEFIEHPIEKTEEALKQTKEKLTEGAERIKEGIETSKEKVEEKLEEGKEFGKEKLEEGKEFVEEKRKRIFG